MEVVRQNIFGRPKKAFCRVLAHRASLGLGTCLGPCQFSSQPVLPARTSDQRNQKRRRVGQLTFLILRSGSGKSSKAQVNTCWVLKTIEPGGRSPIVLGPGFCDADHTFRLGSLSCDTFGPHAVACHTTLDSHSGACRALDEFAEILPRHYPAGQFPSNCHCHAGYCRKRSSHPSHHSETRPVNTTHYITHLSTFLPPSQRQNTRSTVPRVHNKSYRLSCF